MKGWCQSSFAWCIVSINKIFITNFNFRIITNPEFTICTPGAPECIQPSNEFAVKLMKKGMDTMVEKLPRGRYLMPPVGLDDGDAEPFVHPDDRKKQKSGNKNQRCKKKCEGKKKIRQCEKKCDKNASKPGKPSRTERASGPATKKPAAAGKGCDEKCGQLRGPEKRQCKKRKKKQCNGKGEGSGQAEGSKTNHPKKGAETTKKQKKSGLEISFPGN